MEKGGGGWRRVEEGGGEWRRVEEGGGGWRRMEEGGGGWRTLFGDTKKAGVSQQLLEQIKAAANRARSLFS